MAKQVDCHLQPHKYAMRYRDAEVTFGHGPLENAGIDEFHTHWLKPDGVQVIGSRYLVIATSKQFKLTETFLKW